MRPMRHRVRQPSRRRPAAGAVATATARATLSARRAIDTPATARGAGLAPPVRAGAAVGVGDGTRLRARAAERWLPGRARRRQRRAGRSGRSSATTSTPWLWALAILVPGSAVLRWLDSWVSHDLAYRLLAELRIRLYQLLDPLAPAYLVRRRTGDLVSALLGDVELIELFYAHTISPLFVAILVPGGVLIALAVLAPRPGAGAAAVPGRRGAHAAARRAAVGPARRGAARHDRRSHAPTPSTASRACAPSPPSTTARRAPAEIARAQPRARRAQARASCAGRRSRTPRSRR